MNRKIAVLIMCVLLIISAACNDSKQNEKEAASSAQSLATEATSSPTETPTNTPEATASTPKDEEIKPTIQPGQLTYAGGILSEEAPKEQAMLCDLTGPAAHYQIIEDMAVQFFPTTAFKEVSVCCPSYNDNRGTLTFSLYAWQGSYGATVNKEAIKTATFADYRDNELLTLSFEEELPDGEYLLLMSTPDYSEGVGVWGKACNFEGQKVYIDGGNPLPEHTEIHVELRVSYVNLPNNIFGPVSE